MFTHALKHLLISDPEDTEIGFDGNVGESFVQHSWDTVR